MRVLGTGNFLNALRQARAALPPDIGVFGDSSGIVFKEDDLPSP
jgi:hypothetical protein